MIPKGDPVLALLVQMSAELDRRVHRSRLINPYYEGAAPTPAAISMAGVTRAYRTLMPLSDAPWGSLIVDSVQDRLELAGLQDSKGKDKAARIWEVLQANHIDSESKLVHNSTLVDGRAFATVWPSATGTPRVTFDGSDMMIVKYAQGSRYDRVAALRRWTDDDTGRPYATLYTPAFIYKFQGPKNSSGQGGTRWEPRHEGDEPWPLPNVMESVPVVEFGVNRRLKPGVFGYARGEFEHCLGLIDRINLLTFLGLVVAFWMGFPVRGIIGDKILKDDQGKPLPPFNATADSVVQFENPDVKPLEFAAADRGNLSIFPELTQLAMITKTPRHYFPYQGGLSNISADAIRADEGALNAKVVDHKSGLGESHLEVSRLVGKAMDDEIELNPNASVEWKNHESRSLAEQADAASKLAPVLPWQVIAERALNATGEEIQRWAALRENDAMSMLAQAALSANRVGAAVTAAAEGDQARLQALMPGATLNSNGKPANGGAQ